MAKKTYTAVYTPAGEPGAWTVQIAEETAAISHGRSIAQARTRIREALALVLDVEENRFDLRDEVRLPTSIRKKVEAYRTHREKAEREAEVASSLSRDAVRELLKAGFSTRDAGEALGLSQTRVAQLAAG